MTVLEKKSLTDRLYEIIRQDIVDQKLKCGEKINIEDLKKKYNVSQTPIREALNRLQQDGLVENITNSGVKVIEIGRRDIIEIFRVYAALDCYAIRWAMEKKDHLPDLEKELGHHLEQHRAAYEEGDLKKSHFHQVAFHRAFYKFTDNSRLDRFYVLIQGQYDIVTTNYMNIPEHRELALREHEAILQAVKMQDVAKAVEAMECHIERSLQRLLENKDRSEEN